LYSWETQHGSKKRCFEFGIPLKEVQLDPLKNLEKKTEKLQKKVEDQEALILKLGNENNKLKSDSFPALEIKMEKLQKKVEEQELVIAKLVDENIKLKSETDKNILQLDRKIEGNMQEKFQKFEQSIKDMLISVERRCNLYEIENRLDQKMKEIDIKTLPYRCQFNPLAKNASSFIFSNNNESVTMNQNFNWKAIAADKPLPKTQTSFSVKIDQSTSNYIMIGIIPATLLQSNTCYNSSGAYMYYAYNGYVYINQTSTSTGLGDLKTGSIVTVTVNLSANKIEWTLKDGKSWSTTLDSSLTNSCDFYPCVELHSQNDRVSFV